VKASKLIALAWLLGWVLSGCISTTTGAPAPEADNSDAAELNYQLGARYFRNGSYELARDRLLLAIELDPKLAIAHQTLAMTYEALDNKRLATEHYERAVKAAPRNFDILNAYAVFLCKQSDFDEAKRYFEKAAAHPENDNAERTLTNAGICMAQKPDLDEAERLYRAALDRRPAYGEALLQLCLLKYQQTDYLSARAFLQRFMTSNRTTAGVLFLAAEIEGKLGNDRGRTEFVNQLLRQFPESPEARKALSSS
jgi:type IV pilus assembly protein PilF